MSEVKLVKLSDIDALSFDVRIPASEGGTAGLDADGMGDIINSVAQDGDDVAILLAKRNGTAWEGEGEPPPYIVIDGRRRYHAKVASGSSHIFAIISDAPPETWRRKALVMNAQRQDLTPYETAQALLGLKSGGTKQKDIAKLLGKSESWVSRYLKILKLPTERAKALSHGDLADAFEEVTAHERKAKGQAGPKERLTPDQRLEKALKLSKQVDKLLSGEHPIRRAAEIDQMVMEVITGLETLTGKQKDEGDDE